MVFLHLALLLIHSHAPGACPPSQGEWGGGGEEGKSPRGRSSPLAFGLCPFAFCVAHAKGQNGPPPISLPSPFPFLHLSGSSEKTKAPPPAFRVHSGGKFFFSDYKAIKANLMNGLVMMPSFLWMPSSSSWFHWSISHKISLWWWGFFSRPSCW